MSLIVFIYTFCQFFNTNISQSSESAYG